jgi:hypothetical protein
VENARQHRQPFGVVFGLRTPQPLHHRDALGGEFENKDRLIQANPSPRIAELSAAIDFGQSAIEE